MQNTFLSISVHSCQERTLGFSVKDPTSRNLAQRYRSIYFASILQTAAVMQTASLFALLDAKIMIVDPLPIDIGMPSSL